MHRSPKELSEYTRVLTYFDRHSRDYARKFRRQENTLERPQNPADGLMNNSDDGYDEKTTRTAMYGRCLFPSQKTASVMLYHTSASVRITTFDACVRAPVSARLLSRCSAVCLFRRVCACARAHSRPTERKSGQNEARSLHSKNGNTEQCALRQRPRIVNRLLSSVC
ncbi:uncharacterized protein LOC143143095 [Ptiloglossa arizonensis]|uniref:uncharacterized protein LOC143143095 n=1 Tax=Ptiloglossa arizonensis TaxID=3350558 RepID=UPI003F9F4599